MKLILFEENKINTELKKEIDPYVKKNKQQKKEFEKLMQDKEKYKQLKQTLEKSELLL